MDSSSDKYIDFGVAPYALPYVCEALFNNGVTNGFLTKEDGDIHIRWKYDIQRKYRENNTVCVESNETIEDIVNKLKE